MSHKAIVQVVGYKNSGKTTTSCELIKRFSEDHYQVGSIKHDAHYFEVDYPGKDTWRHREAGATVVAISSQEKTAIMEQRPTGLDELLKRMQGVDVVIVEGYKFADYPKVVLLRSEDDLHLIEKTSKIIAISTWFPYEHPTIPVIDKNDFGQIYQAIIKYFDLN